MKVQHEVLLGHGHRHDGHVRDTDLLGAPPLRGGRLFNHSRPREVVQRMWQSFVTLLLALYILAALAACESLYQEDNAMSKKILFAVDKSTLGPAPLGSLGVVLLGEVSSDPTLYVQRTDPQGTDWDQIAATSATPTLVATPTAPTRSPGTPFKPSATNVVMGFYEFELQPTATDAVTVRLRSDAANPPTTIRGELDFFISGETPSPRMQISYCVPANHFVLLEVTGSGGATADLVRSAEVVLGLQ